jgi:hypothetical protein
VTERVSKGAGSDGREALRFRRQLRRRKIQHVEFLRPGLDLPTDEVSLKLGRGKHTTRHVELFRLDNGALVADTRALPPSARRTSI